MAFYDCVRTLTNKIEQNIHYRYHYQNALSVMSRLPPFLVCDSPPKTKTRPRYDKEHVHLQRRKRTKY